MKNTKVKQKLLKILKNTQGYCSKEPCFFCVMLYECKYFCEQKNIHELTKEQVKKIICQYYIENFSKDDDLLEALLNQD